MKRNRLLSTLVAVAIVGAIVGTAAGSSKTKSGRAVAAASSLAVKRTAEGSTLVDAHGRTVYLFAADKPNVSKLSRAGFGVWPAFTATRVPRAAHGVSAANIGLIAGPNGTRQVTYNRHPLYYYVGDQKPGDTRGQGLNQFGALWYVLSPSGNATTKTASSQAPAAPAPSGGYGY
jgi:predicted lipoprotein with Yx(FWY)xxD motif